MAACGGGGGSATPAAPQPPAQHRVEVYSDSTGLTPGTGGLPWPEQLQLPGAAVVNHSVPGIGAMHVLPGSARFGVLPWAQRMAASPADTVVIALCINDAVNTSLFDYSANLTALAQTAQASGKRVVLATPNPTALPEVAQAAQAMREVASALHLELIDNDADLRPWHAALTRDGVHPVASTADRMATLGRVRLLVILGY